MKMKDQLRTYLSNELADLIVKARRDDADDKEDIVNLLQRVNKELQERPAKILDMNLTKSDSLRDFRAGRGSKTQIGFSVSPVKSKQQMLTPRVEASVR